MLHTFSYYTLVLAITSAVFVKPEGVYHQEYQYQKSSSSFKNNELQHKLDDEGFYTKDGDLAGNTDPKVNEQHEHREFLHPKLRGTAGGTTVGGIDGASYEQGGMGSSGRLTSGSQYQQGVGGGHTSNYHHGHGHGYDERLVGEQGATGSMGHVGATGASGSVGQTKTYGYSGGSGYQAHGNYDTVYPSLTSIPTQQAAFDMQSTLGAMMANLQHEMQRKMREQVETTHSSSTSSSSSSSSNSNLLSAHDTESLRRRLKDDLDRQLSEAMRRQYGNQWNQGTYSGAVTSSGGTSNTHSNYDQREFTNLRQSVQDQLMKDLDSQLEVVGHVNYDANERRQSEGSSQSGVQVFPVGSTQYSNNRRPSSVHVDNTRSYGSDNTRTYSQYPTTTKSTSYSYPDGIYRPESSSHNYYSSGGPRTVYNQPRPYSSLEQDDLNQTPEKFADYSPHSHVTTGDQQSAHASSHSSHASSSSNYGTTGSNYHHHQVPLEPIVENPQQILNIAQLMQGQLQRQVIKSLNEYQEQNAYSPTSTYNTKPDYQQALREFKETMRRNMTVLLDEELKRQFGQQVQRGDYFFTRGTSGNSANYKLDDLNSLTAQVKKNLDDFMRKSLESQESQYESYRTSSSSSSSSSYSSGSQYQPSGSQYHPSGSYQAVRAPSTAYKGGYAGGASSHGAASHGAYTVGDSTGAGLQTKTMYPSNQQYTAGAGGSSSFQKYGQFQSSSSYSSGSDCTECMMGDDPSVYNNDQRVTESSLPYYVRSMSHPTQQRYVSLADLYNSPKADDFQQIMTSQEEFDVDDNVQRPVLDDDDDDDSQRVVDDDFQGISNLENGQRMRQMEDYQKIMMAGSSQRVMDDNDDVQRVMDEDDQVQIVVDGPVVRNVEHRQVNKLEESLRKFDEKLGNVQVDSKFINEPASSNYEPGLGHYVVRDPKITELEASTERNVLASTTRSTRGDLNEEFNSNGQKTDPFSVIDQFNSEHRPRVTTEGQTNKPPVVGVTTGRSTVNIFNSQSNDDYEDFQQQKLTSLEDTKPSYVSSYPKKYTSFYQTQLANSHQASQSRNYQGATNYYLQQPVITLPKLTLSPSTSTSTSSYVYTPQRQEQSLETVSNDDYDFQNIIEDDFTIQKPVYSSPMSSTFNVRDPIEGPDDLQKVIHSYEMENVDNHDSQVIMEEPVIVRTRVNPYGRRQPPVNEKIVEAPKQEQILLANYSPNLQQAYPKGDEVISSDENLISDENDEVYPKVTRTKLEERNATQESKSFWRKMGGKISSTYLNAKQKAKDLVDQITG